MTQRISGKNFDIEVGDFTIRVSSASLEISDNFAVALDKGIPNGWVDGDVTGEGEFQVDASNLNLIIESADRAGSFQELEPSDFTFFAKTPNNELKVQAFGCKMKISSLLDIDTSGGEKHLTTIPFLVTSPDFVRINGVRYLSKAATDGLI